MTRTITICTSASFYKKAVGVMKELEAMGFKVIVPSTVHKMIASNNFDPMHYKTWFQNKDHYDQKAHLMREHFREVERGDICLVLNYQKHGIKNYIGGNVLMEMALAFYLKKPIVILNKLPKHSPFLEEISGMEPVLLNGNLEKIREALKTKRVPSRK